ncbi:MAG: HAMP domain-containing sensor histidine kinase [Desulfurivibrio sp.]|nr:HAMP domain-containing sensor histidine kinase [Desulfurivibrio sp.]
MQLTVQDNGEGIAPEIIPRIFEPYFTTKRRSEGSGMGLAMAHGIVKALGGDITVHSAEGVGTTFKVFLPAVQAATKQPGPTTT